MTVCKIPLKTKGDREGSEKIMIGVTMKDRVTNEDLRMKSRVQNIIKTIK